MNLAYGADFARLYDALWAGFAVDAAPLLHQFLSASTEPEQPARVLDLCCGTGQLARYLLDRGYAVTGVDLSEDMLTHARRNAGPHLQSGLAEFVQADAADFTLPRSFTFVTSTYDAINHLPDLEALRGCLTSVARVTVPGGRFIFDLNTRQGLLDRWNGTIATDDDRVFLVNRGRYDGGLRAEMTITGFVPDPDHGGYSRFDETAFNTVFALEDVARLATETGWSEVHFARLDDLATPLAEPEREGRVFAVLTLGHRAVLGGDVQHGDHRGGDQRSAEDDVP